MKTMRITAIQTVEFKQDIEAALTCVAVTARDQTFGASLL